MTLLRPAKPGDELELARVHVESWQVAYRGLIPDAYLDGLKAEDRARQYDFATTDPSKPFTIAAVVDDRIVGFVATMPSRSADLPDDGEIAALYVSPQNWDRKIGAALIVAARERLVSQGFEFTHLWVLQGNVRAERFYRKDGWSPDGAVQTDTSRGFPLIDVRYRRVLVGGVGV